MSSHGTSLNTSATVAAPGAAAGANKVGYGKPPKATQWKKGESGNPAGKKPGVKNFSVLFNKVALKEAVVTAPNGQKVKKTLLELLISSVFTYAQSGKKAMMPVAAQLLESQFYEPAEKPPVLNKIMKGPDGVYMITFMSNAIAKRLDNLMKAAKVLNLVDDEDDQGFDGDIDHDA